MKELHKAVNTMLVAALLTSGFLFSGCKKNQPTNPAPSSPMQASVFLAVKGFKGPEAIPADALRNVQQGIEHVRSRDYDAAIREFSTAIEQYPSYFMAYNDRAAAYIRRNNFDKARTDLTKALEINPDSPFTYYNFAAFYAIQRQAVPALDNLDKALELGFRDYDFLRADPDLNNIRENPEYRKILDKHGVFVSK